MKNPFSTKTKKILNEDLNVMQTITFYLVFGICYWSSSTYNNVQITDNEA